MDDNLRLRSYGAGAGAGAAVSISATYEVVKERSVIPQFKLNWMEAQSILGFSMHSCSIDRVQPRNRIMFNKIIYTETNHAETGSGQRRTVKD